MAVPSSVWGVDLFTVWTRDLTATARFYESRAPKAGRTGGRDDATEEHVR